MRTLNSGAQVRGGTYDTYDTEIDGGTGSYRQQSASCVLDQPTVKRATSHSSAHGSRADRQAPVTITTYYLSDITTSA